MPSIKFRNGWDGAGSQTANLMAGEGERHTAQRLRDGVLTERHGKFINVYKDDAPTPPGDDGFYSLGDITTVGNTRILGSASGYHFNDRGPAPAQGGFVFAEVGYFGRGLGEVSQTEYVSYYTNFDGQSCLISRYDIYRTRDGRGLRAYYDVPSFLPAGQSHTYSISLPGGYWFNGTKHAFYIARAVPVMTSDGQMFHAVVVDDGATSTPVRPSYGLPTFIHNQLPWYADLMTLAPGKLLKMDRYLRPTYSGSSVVTASCPGLVWSYSEDAGHTWTTLAPPALWASELASLITLTADHSTLARVFNNALDYASMKTAPLSRTKSVVQAIVPYWDGTTVKAKVKLGIIDRSSYSITETAVLFDGTLDDANYYAGRPPLAVKGGVLIFSRDVTHGGSSSWRYPARLHFTSDGSSLVDRGVMPVQESYLGLVNGYDTHTLVVPMWDGKHSIYMSKDFGVTWTRKGTITSRGVPPNDTPAVGHEQYFLQDFTIITFLRKSGAPAPAAPLTPWLYDSRQPDPIAP